MKASILACGFIVFGVHALAHGDTPSQGRTDGAQSPPALVTDVRGVPYKPLDGGYINLRNGRYYVRSGPDFLIDAQTGQGVPIAKPKESH